MFNKNRPTISAGSGPRVGDSQWPKTQMILYNVLAPRWFFWICQIHHLTNQIVIFENQITKLNGECAVKLMLPACHLTCLLETMKFSEYRVQKSLRKALEATRIVVWHKWTCQQQNPEKLAYLTQATFKSPLHDLDMLSSLLKSLALRRLPASIDPCKSLNAIPYFSLTAFLSTCYSWSAPDTPPR